jgi:hypothetical protein
VPEARVANTAVAVQAGPVERYAGAPTSNLTILGDALEKASPQFKAFLKTRQTQNENDDLFEGKLQAKKDSIGNEVDEGIAFDSLKSEQTAAFQKGYVAMMGMMAGQRKSAELQQIIQTEVYEKDGDFDTVVNGFLNENMQGLDDVDYSMPFLQEIAAIEDKARLDYVDYQKAAIDVEKQTGYSEMMGKMAESIEGSTPEQMVINMEAAEANGRALGLDHATMNEITVDRFIALANDGRPELLEFFKLKRSNGSQGLWHNPKWTAKLDKALDSAIGVQTRQLEAQQKASDKEIAANKKAKQSDLIARLMNGEDIYSALFEATANHEIEPSASQALFGIVRSISNDQDSNIKEAAEGDREAKKNVLSYRILSGALGSDDVMKEWSSDPSSLKSGDWTGLMADAQEMEDPNGIFQSEDYKASVRLLKVIEPRKDATGINFVDPEQGVIYREAMNEFYRRVRKLDAEDAANFDSLNELTKEVREKYEKQTNDLTSRYEKQLTYPTFAEFNLHLDDFTEEEGRKQLELFKLLELI